jgi:gamma-glutamyltranspeptidase
VLLRNGTAVDAAIAATFCNGVHVSHSMGIGGGHIMTVYIKYQFNQSV